MNAATGTTVVPVDFVARAYAVLTVGGQVVLGFARTQDIGLIIAAAFLLGSLAFGILVLHRLGQVAETSARILQRADRVLEKQQRLEDSLKRD